MDVTMLVKLVANASLIRSCVKKSKEKQEIHSIFYNKANKIHIKGNCLNLEL